MTEKRVLLDTAAFLDSARALEISIAPTAAIRTIVQRYLASCYEDLGKAPRLLDGEELGTLLREVLPTRFGARDELAEMTEEVLDHYLRFLTEVAVVTHAFEQRRAFDEHIGAFLSTVASGAAHADGVALRGPGTTIRHQAAKVGRNDPCPCGSGRKFKKCCMTLGE